jgi:hypothetical protein
MIFFQEGYKQIKKSTALTRAPSPALIASKPSGRRINGLNRMP